MFAANNLVCTTDEYVRYFDWEATARWENDKGLSIVFDFFLLNSTTRFSEMTTPLFVTKVDSAMLRHKVAIASSASIPRSSINDSLVFDLSPEVVGMNVSIFVENTEVLADNIIWSNKSHELLLTQKKITLSLSATGAQESKKQIEPSSSGSKSVTTATKVAVAAFSSVAVASTSFSFNFAFAFIKLFQIIEILGKFYFLPIDFSALLNSFLQFIFGISDLVVTKPSLLINQPTDEVLQSFGKLTYLKQESHMLRSMPLAVVVYGAVALLDLLARKTARRALRRRGWLHSLIVSITGVKVFLLQMSIVDILFYGAYALAGSWKSFDPLVTLNKLIALLLIYDVLCFTLKVSCLCIEYKRDTRDTVLFEYLKKVAFEGLDLQKPAGVKARSLNAVFLFKLYIFQTSLVALQHSPALCISVIGLAQGLSGVHLFYVWFKFNPFQGRIAFLERAACEVCISVFMIAVVVRATGFYHIACDYITIGFVGLSILMQTASILLEAVQLLRQSYNSMKAKKVRQTTPPASLQSTLHLRTDFKKADLVSKIKTSSSCLQPSKRPRKFVSGKVNLFHFPTPQTSKATLELPSRKKLWSPNTATNTQISTRKCLDVSKESQVNPKTASCFNFDGPLTHQKNNFTSTTHMPKKATNIVTSSHHRTSSRVLGVKEIRYSPVQRIAHNAINGPHSSSSHNKLAAAASTHYLF